MGVREGFGVNLTHHKFWKQQTANHNRPITIAKSIGYDGPFVISKWNYTNSE
jgi:hypothetical protein